MTEKISKAKLAVEESGILGMLKAYSAEVVSTIFVELDTSTSDIDIVCCYEDKSEFEEFLMKSLIGFDQVQIRCLVDRVVAEFTYYGFAFEIFACPTKVEEQFGYRHYQIMKRLVAASDDRFNTQVRELKNAGMKTEPAICRVLDIDGDPYIEILNIERWSDEELMRRLKQTL